jgi:hypothetical protein
MFRDLARAHSAEVSLVTILTEDLELPPALRAWLLGEFLEIRCCCEPAKLLGWIRVPDLERWRREGAVTFLLQPERGDRLADQVEAIFAPRTTLRLELATWSDSRRGIRDRLAFRSDDTPLETLRRIPGFIELQPRLAETAASSPIARPLENHSR